MRSINIKDALIGALLATVLFMVIGANTENDGQEEIAAVFNDAGAHAVLITNKGTVILVNAKKQLRGEHGRLSRWMRFPPTM